MYTVVEWREDLDLTAFYKEAEEKGFANNSSQRVMIDCFRNEQKWNAWILYEDSNAIGSVAAHSFDDVMGPGSYRILTRCCVLRGARSSGGMMTANVAIGQHQNLTDQFLLPACINWAGNNVYATSNESKVASQRFVHRTYFPTLEKIGVVEKVKDVFYRGTEQTVWKIHVNNFYENLNRYPRWI
jgi:hypothetical protein